MDILHLFNKIFTLTVIPILLILGIVGFLKLLVPLFQKLSDKLFQVIDKQSAKPRPIGRFGRFAFLSFKIMIGYIIFITFLRVFSLPLYLMLAPNSEPPIVLVILLSAMAILFSGIITYTLMKIVHKNFKELLKPKHFYD